MKHITMEPFHVLNDNLVAPQIVMVPVQAIPSVVDTMSDPSVFEDVVVVHPQISQVSSSIFHHVKTQFFGLHITSEDSN